MRFVAERNCTVARSFNVSGWKPATKRLDLSFLGKCVCTSRKLLTYQRPKATMLFDRGSCCRWSTLCPPLPQLMKEEHSTEKALSVDVGVLSATTGHEDAYGYRGLYEQEAYSVLSVTPSALVNRTARFLRFHRPRVRSMEPKKAAVSPSFTQASVLHFPGELLSDVHLQSSNSKNSEEWYCY